MIKVFRNHVCLCACTTAILSLLQTGREVYAVTEDKGKPYIITVKPINGSYVTSSHHYLNGSHLSGNNRHKLPLKGETGGKGYLPHHIDIDNDDEGIRGGSDYRVLSGLAGENDKVINKDSDGRGVDPAFYYYNSGLYYVCDNCGMDSGKDPKIDNKSYTITKENVSSYPEDPTAITVKRIGTRVSGENVTVSSEVADKSFLRGVAVSDDGKIVLIKPTLKNTKLALFAKDGIIQVKQGIIEESNRAVEAVGNSLVILEGTKVNTQNGKTSLSSYSGAEIGMESGEVNFMNSHGISAMLGGKVFLDGVKVIGKGEKDKDHAVFLMDEAGSVKFKGGTIYAENTHGILLENSVKSFNGVPERPEVEAKTEDEIEDLSNSFYATEIDLKSSFVTVKGEGAYGIYFKGEKPWSADRDKKEDISLGGDRAPARLEVVNLDATEFSVLDDVALYGKNVISGAVSLSKSTLRSENFLLKAEKGASVIVLADDSTLEGHAYVDGDSNAELYLGGHSTWTLQQQLPKERHKVVHDSSISVVSLMGNSSINFKRHESSSMDDYQTLRIGNGKGVVYKARDGASIFLNTYLNKGGDLNNQKSDRVLIYGDVEGKTTVRVRAVSGSSGGYTGSGGNSQGISVIQVSGKAKQDSFQLEGGYVALDGLPYQYKLYGYGPISLLGQANENQRLVAGNGEFWDFRLESQFIDSDARPEPDPSPTPPPGPTPSPGPAPEPHPRPKPGVKAVVPQVPTYLLLPNVLLQVSLMNVGNQNKRLESLRIASRGLLENREKPLFFVNGYGGNHRYISNLSALEYGYGGELFYNAVEAGVLLQAIENMYGTASFGVIGSYEKFSLQPLNVEQSQKSTFDKWSVAAYGGMQHDAGFYVDGLVSYGFFKGDVLTTARGKTATLKGNPLSASLIAGKTLMVGDDGFVFDPQVQVVYQYLQFNKVRDVDGFDIELGKIHQWIGRVGGRLTKILVTPDEARVVSIYGKLNLAHGFGGERFVHFKDAFQLGAFGSSLETGLGFNAQLSQNFALHGDLVYQHKLTKAGFSGTSFSGGLRYHF
ncbi:autotransporter outer membrane beta-barrel domain-containing protein [Bartonella rattimassiliensis]|uniref:Outer membrane autotransporter barrel domain-containing protein n=1 Tax=Bartonella rattimassiliensis 15908 TaxID=1094556 RepID=J1JJY2_9HYPH|nr:autotransporter outer membrane beta-barrel domain-containing protein [Bartonella rattimassiliensis]EJF84952.1 outer membrane autotransporter barrel domain-containing protein [Bartonella rattimassiliensis 15908]